MKSILLALLFLFIPKLCNSQISTNDKMIYLDSTWNETTKKNHKYYRIIKDYYLDKDLYIINEYYKSDAKRTEGFSKNKDNFEKEGELTLYFENGNKHKICHYLNKKLIGKEFEWYENGNKKREIEYTPTEKESQNKIKIIQYWNKNNIQTIIDGNGDFEESYKEFYGSGKLKNGYKDGIWQGWQINPENKYTENYETGKFISGIITDENNTKTPYSELATKAEPNGGYTIFYKYIAKTFQMPDVSGLNGKIITTFIIDKDGKATEPKTIKSIGYGTDEEAIRVITNYKWIPRIQRGQKVKSSFSIPISIKTADGSNTKHTPSPSEMIKNTNRNW
ncbi:energy transducer TonB [Flavobacterium sp.]|uniref:energy transducer TonB n=1 Tax=Flavobacterium sp. TaxID=239 RepID=UPI001B6F132D|nr:energy transducer TonB [Flavobacterium sp.]MBP6182359.1 energy transducer TonB [Flavobacterium sp.]